MRFWDASAIVPLLVEEPQHPKTEPLLEQDSGMVVAEHDPPSLELVSLDRALSAVALREGFPVLPIEP